jgi:hypothetical protein
VLPAHRHRIVEARRETGVAGDSDLEPAGPETPPMGGTTKESELCIPPIQDASGSG